MFGDIGHGLFVFFFGLYLMLMTPNKFKPGTLESLYPYRYFITMMGINAAFCGYVYNDFLGFSLNLHGSCYSTRTG